MTKLHLDDARKLRGIHFIDPEDKEFKENIKNAGKKLDTPVAVAIPCKIMKKNCGSGASNKIKTKLACILEASESTRMRMEESLPKHHEDHFAGKGNNSLQHYIRSQIYSCTSSHENSSSKGSSGKGMGKLEQISVWNLTKVRSKKEVIDEARTSGAKVHLHH